MHDYLICKLAEYQFGTKMMLNICDAIDNQKIKTKKNLNILDSLFSYFSRFKPQFLQDNNPANTMYQSNLIGSVLEKMIYENVVFKEWLISKINSEKIKFKYQDTYYNKIFALATSNVFGDSLIFRNGETQEITLPSESFMNGTFGPCLVFKERKKEIVI